MSDGYRGLPGSRGDRNVPLRVFGRRHAVALWRVGADQHIMLEHINQRWARRRPIEDAALEGAVPRLRPSMMTMPVVPLRLLAAAMSHDIGSDSQRPFAIVIVGGLISDLLHSTVLLPTFYVWIARGGEALPPPG